MTSQSSKVNVREAPHFSPRRRLIFQQQQKTNAQIVYIY